MMDRKYVLSLPLIIRLMKFCEFCAFPDGDGFYHKKKRGFAVFLSQQSFLDAYPEL